MRQRNRRSAFLACLSALLLVVPVGSADADAGYVDVRSFGPSGRVEGVCDWVTTLPSRDNFDEISIAFQGTAVSVSSRMDVTVISTSIYCYLRHYAFGEAGIAMPGPVATVAGTGIVWRYATDPEACAVVSAAFSDGTIAPPQTHCVDIA